MGPAMDETTFRTGKRTDGTLVPMGGYRETQETVAAWASNTFGRTTPLRIAQRANEEMAELMGSAVRVQDADAIITEAADVVIVLYRLAADLGKDLMADIDRKMEINRQRQWGRDAAGRTQHVIQQEETGND